MVSRGHNAVKDRGGDIFDRGGGELGDNKGYNELERLKLPELPLAHKP